MPFLNLSDYHTAALKKLPKGVMDYFDSGSDDQFTRDLNIQAFSRYRLLPRILRDVSQIELSTELVGLGVDSPIMIGPCAFHKLAHPEGELATARAAEKTKSLMVVSTMANHSLEEIKSQVTNAWFQLYVYSDRSITEGLVRRAEAAGYRAVVITVDTPLMGNREADKINQFKLPDDCVAANFPEKLSDVSYQSSESTVSSYTAQNFDRAFVWDDIDWLKSVTKLPIVLKGVLHPADARKAVEKGVSAIIVSNHGGRQVDTTPATIEILPKIVGAVDKRIPILMDSGVRRSTDIIKALALGASAILIARPILWGLAVSGQKGVEDVINILKKELRLNMALMGHPTIRSIQCAEEAVVCSESELGVSHFKAKL